MSSDETSVAVDRSISKFFQNTGISFGVCLLALGIFCFIHRWKFMGISLFFSPRKKEVLCCTSPYFYGMFSWIWPSLSYPDSKLWKTHGPDALCYVRFLRLCLGLSVYFLAIGMFVIIPINVSGGVYSHDPEAVTEMGILTIANIPSRDDRLIAHVLFTWIHSIVFYFAMWYMYHTFGRMRQHYLNRNEVRAFTLMLQNVPKRLRRESALREWFEDHYPVGVVDVQIIWDTRKLNKLCQQRLMWLSRLERIKMELRDRPELQTEEASAESEQRSSTSFENLTPATIWKLRIRRCWKQARKILSCYYICGCNRACCVCCSCCCCECCVDRTKRPTTRSGWFQCFGKKVDAEKYYARLLSQTEDKIRFIQENPAGRMQKTGVAFVTLSSAFVTRVGAQPFMNPGQMVIRPAPEYSDVNWSVLSIGPMAYSLRKFLIAIILTVIMILWTFPFLFLVSIANLTKLSTVDGFGWLEDVLDALPESLVNFIEGFLPALITTIFIAIMKPIFTFIINFRGFMSHSVAEFTTLNVYATFLLLNVFLVSTIGGAVFDVLEDVIDNPASIITLLGTSLPKQSLYFIDYLLVTGVGRLPIKLYRPGQLFNRYMNKFCKAPKTKREKETVHKPPPFDYAGEAGRELLVFTLVLNYSVMAPLISLFGVVYFSLSYLIHRYNILYCNEPFWESGCTMWQYAYHHFLTALLVFQLTMMGLLGFDGIDQVGATLIVLPIITIVIWVKLHNRYKWASRYGPLSGTYALNMAPPEAKGVYIPPSMVDIEMPVSSDEEEGEGMSSKEHTVVVDDKSGSGGNGAWGGTQRAARIASQRRPQTISKQRIMYYKRRKTVLQRAVEGMRRGTITIRKEEAEKERSLPEAGETPTQLLPATLEVPLLAQRHSMPHIGDSDVEIDGDGGAVDGGGGVGVGDSGGSDSGDSIGGGDGLVPELTTGEASATAEEEEEEEEQQVQRPVVRRNRKMTRLIARKVEDT